MVIARFEKIEEPTKAPTTKAPATKAPIPTYVQVMGNNNQTH